MMQSTIPMEPIKEQLRPRIALVEVMKLSLSYWELSTGLTKLELAETTKIWQTQVDGDNIRVRTLDRYLNVDKLPKYPKWVNVIKTGNFVLNIQPSNQQTSALKIQLEKALENLELLLSKFHQTAKLNS